MRPITPCNIGKLHLHLRQRSPNLLAIPYPLLHLISQERNRSAASPFLKNIILTPHTHTFCWMLERDGIDVATGCGCTPTDVSGARSNGLYFVAAFPFHTTCSLFLFLCLSNHESSCFLFFIYHVRAGDGECNCSSKHDISLSNPCVPFHMCVRVCSCVFLFALLYLPEKQTGFLLLSLRDGHGWGRGGDVM